jgi:hypothetical protein
MRIRALVQDKVMLMLVDSRSSHSFVSASFLLQTKIQPQEVSSMQVKVANGEILLSSQPVRGLEWWAQGHTFHTDMRVLQMGEYDAILGYDWLSTHSHMVCHWDLKTLEF